MSIQVHYKNKIFVILGIIALISIIVKLYSTNFDLPIYSDNFDIAMRSFAHLGGNFDVSPNRNFGLSLFQSPFLLLANSDNFLDYSNIIRLFGIGASTTSIFVMYLLARKFFSEKYSLVAASLFAFSPQLNQSAGLGETEALFLLSLMCSLYFILRQTNDKLVFLSFVFAGIAYTIRPMGMIMIIILLIIYLIHFRKNLKPPKFVFCIFLFALIIIPISLVRYDQYGDPLFYGDVSKGFITDYTMLRAENIGPVSAEEFIQNNSVTAFLEQFVLLGIFNYLKALLVSSLPYMIVLLPAGLLLSLKLKHEIKNFILANWILITSYSLSMIIVSSIIIEPRYVIPLIPFLIIISVLPIQKISELKTNYGNFKTISLIIIMSLLLSSSIIYTYFVYPPPDYKTESEKIEFSKFLHNNLDGNFFNAGWSTHYFTYVYVVDNNSFKNYYLNDELSIENSEIQWLRLYGTSINEIILAGEKLGLKYLVVEQQQTEYKFVDEIYEEEKLYSYLTKVFDSNEYGFENLKVKIFKIDYKVFKGEQ